MRNFSIIPLSGNIQVAIAAAVFPDIRFAIDAGADDIPVLLPVARRQPAGAAHVSITLFVDDQGFKKIEYEPAVGAEIVSLRLLCLSEHLIKLFRIH
jgi:hypothetical protein